MVHKSSSVTLRSGVNHPKLYQMNTVDENIIATTKKRNNFNTNFQYCDSNIELFSIAPCKVFTLNPHCILFGISSFLIALSLVIALPTIAIALKGDSKKITVTFR